MKKTHLKEKIVFYRETKHDYKLLEILAKEQNRTISNLVRKYVHDGVMADSRNRKEGIK